MQGASTPIKKESNIMKNVQTKYFVDLWVFHKGIGVGNTEIEVFEDGRANFHHGGYCDKEYTLTVNQFFYETEIYVNKKFVKEMIAKASKKRNAIIDGFELLFNVNDEEFKMRATFYKVTGRNLRNVGKSGMPL